MGNLSNRQLGLINAYLANMGANASLKQSGQKLSFYSNGQLIASNISFKSNRALQIACINWAH